MLSPCLWPDMTIQRTAIQISRKIHKKHLITIRETNIFQNLYCKGPVVIVCMLYRLIYTLVYQVRVSGFVLMNFDGFNVC